MWLKEKSLKLIIRGCVMDYKNYTLPKDVLFKDFAWVAVSQMAIGAKRNTRADLESRLKRLLIPYFGNSIVKDITPLLIEKWQNNLILSKGTDITRRTKQLLKNILNRAIVYGIIKDNPTIPTSKIRETRRELREIYTKEEVKIMLNASDGWLKLFILTMVSLGLRSGEVIGIRFSDIDWKNRRILIQRSIKFGIFSPPKNGIKRYVDIPLPLMAEFEKAYDERLSSQLQVDYVFISSKNNYFSDSSSIIKKHFKPLLKRLGIKYKTLYSLRHLYATLSLQGGQGIGYISNQLGHKDIKVTMEYYIKYLRNHDDLGRADRILSF
jgi:integrase